MKTYRFKIFGNDYETHVIRKTDDEMVITVNDIQYKAHLETRKDRSVVKPTPKIERPVVAPTIGTKVTAPPDAAKGAGAVNAPMPGLITKVNVKVGDEVTLGQTLLAMEAMKMENNIAANLAGVITEVSVRDGDTVIEGQALMTIEEK